MLKTKTNFPCTSLLGKAAGILRTCLTSRQYGNLHKLWHVVREQLVKSFCRTVELLLKKPWAYYCSPLLKDYRMAESSFRLWLLPFGSEQMYGEKVEMEDDGRKQRETTTLLATPEFQEYFRMLMFN